MKKFKLIAAVASLGLAIVGVILAWLDYSRKDDDENKGTTRSEPTPPYQPTKHEARFPEGNESSLAKARAAKAAKALLRQEEELLNEANEALKSKDNGNSKKEDVQS